MFTVYCCCVMAVWLVDQMIRPFASGISPVAHVMLCTRATQMVWPGWYSCLMVAWRVAAGIRPSGCGTSIAVVVVVTAPASQYGVDSVVPAAVLVGLCWSQTLRRLR